MSSTNGAYRQVSRTCGSRNRAAWPHRVAVHGGLDAQIRECSSTDARATERPRELDLLPSHLAAGHRHHGLDTCGLGNPFKVFAGVEDVKDAGDGSPVKTDQSSSCACSVVRRCRSPTVQVRKPIQQNRVGWRQGIGSRPGLTFLRLSCRPYLVIPRSVSKYL